MRETVNAVNRGNVWIVNVEISILHFSIFFPFVYFSLNNVLLRNRIHNNSYVNPSIIF